MRMTFADFVGPGANSRSLDGCGGRRLRRKPAQIWEQYREPSTRPARCPLRGCFKGRLKALALRIDPMAAHIDEIGTESVLATIVVLEAQFVIANDTGAM